MDIFGNNGVCSFAPEDLAGAVVEGKSLRITHYGRRDRVIKSVLHFNSNKDAVAAYDLIYKNIQAIKEAEELLIAKLAKESSNKLRKAEQEKTRKLRRATKKLISKNLGKAWVCRGKCKEVFNTPVITPIARCPKCNTHSLSTTSEFRVCPKCNRYNKITDINCVSCGAKLTYIGEFFLAGVVMFIMLIIGCVIFG